MKRKFLITVLSAAVICAAGTFAACTEKTHEHIWNNGEITKEATCTQTGVKTYTCESCNETKTEAVPKNNNHPHSDEWLKNADEHWQTATCEHTGERVNVSAHDFGEGEVITPATCLKTGLKKYTCVCGETKAEKTGKTAHPYSTDWSNDGEKHWRVCTTDGCTEITDEGAHSWNDGEITIPATCLAEGVKTFTCTDCKFTKTESVDKANHSYGAEWSYDEDGDVHYHACATKDCTEKVDEQAHTYGAWSTEGRIYRECTECGKPEYAPALTMVEESSEWYERLSRATVTVGGGIKSAINVMSKANYYHTVTYSGGMSVKVVCEYYDKDGNLIHNEYTLSPENPSFTELLPDRAIACVFIESNAETAFEYTFGLSVSEGMPNHTHNYSTEWSRDEDYHWHPCTTTGCGEEQDTGLHEYENGVCTVCGYSRPE